MQVAEGKCCSAWVNTWIRPCTLAPALVRARISPLIPISANGITLGKDAWLAAASRRPTAGAVGMRQGEMGETEDIGFKTRDAVCHMCTSNSAPPACCLAFSGTLPNR
mmetsp:Transcript_82476/g.133763  ORF Transcript_82476/g.133763 Transcript_82476/m.133763 type:complete len:108 (-) Transcript_82476:452-775(-)